MVALHANAAEEEKTEGGVAIYDWKRGVLVAVGPPSLVYLSLSIGRLVRSTEETDLV